MQADDLDSKFKIAALDQGSTPIADSIKRENLIRLVPVLTQLGVPPSVIREEIVRAWNLPESFATEAEELENQKIGPRSVPSDLEQQEVGGSAEKAQALATELSSSLTA